MGAKRTIAECWIWNEGRPRGPLAGMSVVGGRAEDICSYRAFLSLTRSGSRRLMREASIPSDAKDAARVARL
jgi:hypothetical protein